jgi:hypothetical protein
LTDEQPPACHERDRGGGLTKGPTSGLRTGDESSEERAFDYARTVALSDGVFAIALTLLVLNITLSALSASHHGELGSRLLEGKSEFAS